MKNTTTAAPSVTVNVSPQGETNRLRVTPGPDAIEVTFSSANLSPDEIDRVKAIASTWESTGMAYAHASLNGGRGSTGSGFYTGRNRDRFNAMWIIAFGPGYMSLNDQAAARAIENTLPR